VNDSTRTKGAASGHFSNVVDASRRHRCRLHPARPDANGSQGLGRNLSGWSLKAGRGASDRNTLRPKQPIPRRIRPGPGRSGSRRETLLGVSGCGGVTGFHSRTLGTGTDHAGDLSCRGSHEPVPFARLFKQSTGVPPHRFVGGTADRARFGVFSGEGPPQLLRERSGAGRGGLFRTPPVIHGGVRRRRASTPERVPRGCPLNER